MVFSKNWEEFDSWYIFVGWRLGFFAAKAICPRPRQLAPCSYVYRSNLLILWYFISGSVEIFGKARRLTAVISAGVYKMLCGCLRLRGLGMLGNTWVVMERQHRRLACYLILLVISTLIPHGLVVGLPYNC